MIESPWKLIWNIERPEGWPEFELYDHLSDPLNLEDVHGEHPELVERLAGLLTVWLSEAEAAATEVEAALEEIDEEQLEHLRALGY